MNNNIKYMDKGKWLSFLQNLHNKVRSAKGIKLTGLPALNEISNFLMLIFTEKYIDKEKLPEICKFSYLYKTYATDEKIKEDNKKPNNEDKNCFKLWNTVYNAKNNDCVLRKLIQNDFFKNYLKSSVSGISAFTEKPLASETIQLVFNMIYKTFDGVNIDYNFYDAFGSAYEQFKTDSVSNTGKHTGQHFTTVSIKQFIIDELKPTGSELFYEPCCGSGGFIHTAFSYIHTHDQKNEVKFKQNVYANECNPEIMKPLMINMLLHDVPITNIKEQDSLDMVLNCEKYKNKFDIVATNPPFGMSTEQKIDEYWDPIKTGKTIAKNSTAQFLLHIYHSLKKGGRAGIVVDRGILNNGDNKKNSWEGNFRKWLLENTNVTKIVLLPTGIFDYTNFATALIFFTKGSKTKEIKYFEGKFENVSKKLGLKIDAKPFKILTFEQFEKKRWTLNANLEEKYIELKKVGWVKLGEILTLYPTTKHCTSIGLSEGKYRFYNSSQTDKLFCNEPEIKKESIIIGNGGTANVHYDVNFTPSKHVTACFDNNNKYNMKMIYYYLRLNINLLEKEFSGGGLKWLNRAKIENIQIPSLSLHHQIEIVEFLDKQFEKYNINLLTDKIKDIPLFDLLVYRQYDNFKSTVNLIYRAIDLEEQYKQYDLDKENVFKCTLNSLVCEEKKLGDVITYLKGSFNTKDIDNSGKYPFYNSGYKNPAGTHSGFTVVDDKEYILFVKDGGNKNDPLSLNSGMAKPFYVTEKCAIQSHVMIMVVSDKKMLTKFLFHYLNYNRTSLMKFAKYNSGLGSIPIENIINFPIKIPSLKDQQNLIKFIEKIEDAKQEHKKYMDYMKVQLDTILENTKEVIKKAEVEYNEKLEKNNKSDDSDSESDKEEKPKKVIKKKLSAKKSKVVSESEDSSSDESDGNSSEEETPKKKLDSDKPKKNAIKKNSDTKSKVDNSSDKSDDSSSEEDEKPKKINKKKLDDDKPKKKPKVKTDDSKIKKNVIVNDSDDSSSNEPVTVKPTKKVTKQNNDSDGEKPSNDKKK